MLNQSFLDQLNSLQILKQLAPLHLAREHLPSDIIDILERLRKADNIPFNQFYYIAENCADRYYSKVIKTFVFLIKRQFVDRQTLLVNSIHSLKFLKEYTDRQAQVWKVLQKYHNLLDEVDDLHSHFESFKSTIETDFKHLKEAMFQNVQNIQRSLNIQQTYSFTLCTHVNNIYNRLSELEKQIQHHCMYPHQTDTVQINALEYDLDIDGDNQPNTHNSRVTISGQGTLNTPQESSILEGDNNTALDNITTFQNQQETNWPEASTIQILGISSTTSDQPPEVMYNRHQIQPSSTDLEIPELEEDSDQHQFTDPDNLITHHNTHQESERIRHEYFTTLQDLSDDEYYTKIDKIAEHQYHTPVSSYDWPTHHQVSPRLQQVGTSQQSTEELKQLFGKGRGKARWEELHSH